MWASIKQIIKPDNYEDALALQKEAGSVLFAGGTYLVAKKDLDIHTLVDINHLLSDTAKQHENTLHIGAGCTLQELIRSGDSLLQSVILDACPSKNIRNQRTIGGEIAQARPDSDLLVYLHTAEAKLQLNETDQVIHIADWDGAGIVTEVQVPQNDVKIERVAVLDSAAAYVIVAVHQTPENITLAVGGKASEIIYCKTSTSPEEDAIRAFMDKIETVFPDDHFGTPAYKRQLVSNLLTEMTVIA